ncbi:7,8-dihydro-6-hydroxymethylpterin-pyrophosphokinase [Candidatus Gastranaerophilus sp. (ex Termes propinquus)]|nr:7,8-dihydro-6-hydroxymethylpterin-pyrophosphokinase [Candidatus Gastranaerophilus sp. (ex Termes propinquus)]
MPTVYLSLGSNTDDRLSNIQQAVNLLTSCNDENSLTLLESSTFYETEPWGGVQTNWFVNAAIKVETVLSPVELIRVCQSVEAKLGRDRSKEERWGKRTIDIDILFYDDLVLANEILSLPHINVHRRAFALVPLLEIAPDFVHPVLNKTITELHEELDDPEDVYLYGTAHGYIKGKE